MSFDDNIDYEKDTIGFHWKMSRVVFGPESAPTKWLEEKAKQSPNGMHETVVIHETQVVRILNELWDKEKTKNDDEPKTRSGMSVIL